jgi:ATP-dependent DNA helicase RecQ
MKIVFEEPGAIIVYAATVKAVDELYRWMSVLDASLTVARYHAKMHPDEREESRARFMDGGARVIVATKAFGMGIDKRDVRAVVHYQLPDSLESYMQEAGRAGRDGDRAIAWLLYRRMDARIWRFLHRKGHIAEACVRAVVDFASRLAPGDRLDTDAIASAAAIGPRKLERLAWELARLGFVTEDAGAFRRAAAGDAFSPESVAVRIVRRGREWEAREEERLEDVLAFAEATGTCRTVRLLAHFGERGIQPCGRCDACRGK